MSAAIPALGFFGKEQLIAPATYNRWLVPPAALAVHLCLGMAYAFSVFWLPLSRAVGITRSVACPRSLGWLAQLLATGCDWQISTLAWTYSLCFVLLGFAPLLWGRWLKRVGPRKAGLVAACCWCGSFVISACGVRLHQITLLWLGSGVIGGIGLGLGYLAPFATLMAWFPDRRNMAVGMLVTGFGGGTMIGAPLADHLMRLFATPTDVGVWETFLILAMMHWGVMIAGTLGYRLPPPGWKPPEPKPGPTSRGRALALIEDHVHPDIAVRTGQFWLLWTVLALNTTAGIGILGMASPLLQEAFGGQLIGVNASFEQLSPAQLSITGAVAAGFVGLLCLFNTVGRLLWVPLSEFIGRQGTFLVFFLVGLTLYASIPWTVSERILDLFVGFCCVMLSLYGGGFATIRAYLADLFGSRTVNAVHGRLLTAGAAAAVLGPVLVNSIRDYALAHGVPRAQAYDTTMYVLAAVLGAGLVCNLLIRPVPEKYHMTRAELAALDGARRRTTPPAAAAQRRTARMTPRWVVVIAWIAVCLPLGWGLWATLHEAALLFRHS